MRTQALFGIIAVVLRAAALILQLLGIGGIVFHCRIAQDDMTGMHERRLGVLLRVSLQSRLSAPSSCTLVSTWRFLSTVWGWAWPVWRRLIFFVA